MADTQYKFPDEQGNEEAYTVEADPEVEIIDDTPQEDRNRKPMAEAPKDFTDDELETYNDSVKKRIQHFTKGYHEERRAKESATREREEALILAQQVIQENQRLKGSLNQGHTALLEQARKVVDNEVNPFASLAVRELEVLHYLLNGYRTKEISTLLGLKMNTISTIKSVIFDKVKAESFTHLLQLAHVHQISY